ncbi:39S mitochondrial ribosomal protein L46-domain-containing protein [Myxozyma melibiosi]|uniref:Large ribosomal subunit protein mL46 n=1 Tax=Myxozyma melibiosi TaxID=54550 RepID=A0ABR1FD18_9ASCO
MVLNKSLRPLWSQSKHVTDIIVASRRALATTTASAEATTEESVSAKEEQKFKLMAGVILSRPPIVTPEPTAFEKAYHHYQSELYKRLSWTFPHWFYFPKGSLAENEYKRVQPQLTEDDPNVLLNRKRDEKQEIVFPPRSVQRETEESARIYAKIVPQPRKTEADEKNDITKLDRKLDRTLYLIVKKEGEFSDWQFPAAPIRKGESLEVASERVLLENGGEDMNVFFVSETPALYYKKFYKEDETYNGAKIFYLKSRIFNGMFKPQRGSQITDYAWVTKEEIESFVSPRYWTIIAPALSLH